MRRGQELRATRTGGRKGDGGNHSNTAVDEISRDGKPVARFQPDYDREDTAMPVLLQPIFSPFILFRSVAPIPSPPLLIYSFTNGRLNNDASQHLPAVSRPFNPMLGPTGKPRFQINVADNCTTPNSD